jgi:hypothetical protein
MRRPTSGATMQVSDSREVIMQTTETIQQLADTVHDKGSSPYVDHDCP